MNGGGSGGGGGGMGGGIGSAFGQIIDAFGNGAKANNQKILGEKQQNRANELAAISANTVAPALQKPILDALATKQMMASRGIPDIDSYNDQLDQHMADAVVKARETGGSGDALLATISGLSGNNNNSRLSLDEQDAATKNNNENSLVDSLWKVGAEKDNNDTIKRIQQSKLNAQSGALSDAATMNNYLAKNKQIDSNTGAVAGISNFAMSAMGGSGGAKGTSESGPGVSPATSTPQTNVSTASPGVGDDGGSIDFMSLGDVGMG